MRAVLAEIDCAPGVAEAAELIISELASNAVSYTASNRPGGSFRAGLAHGAGLVRVEVADQGAESEPVVGGDGGDWDQVHGRGLWMIQRLALRLVIIGDDRLTERFAEDEIPLDAYSRTRDRYLSRRAELDEERQALTTEPAELAPVDYIPVVRNLLDEWDTLPTHRVNKILHDLIEITAYRQDRRTAHATIHTAWGTDHTAPAAEPMGRPRKAE